MPPRAGIAAACPVDDALHNGSFADGFDPQHKSPRDARRCGFLLLTLRAPQRALPGPHPDGKVRGPPQKSGDARIGSPGLLWRARKPRGARAGRRAKIRSRHTRASATSGAPAAIVSSTDQSARTMRNPRTVYWILGGSAKRMAERMSEEKFRHPPPRAIRLPQSPSSQAEPSLGAPP